MYLVCGEALFDLFSRETPGHDREVAFRAIAGGSPFNVAVGLSRLGVRTALLAGLSSDPLGQRLRRVLREEGVVEDYLVQRDAPTTLAMVALGADGSAQYQFRGEGCADRLLRSADLPDPAVRFAGIHVGSYSLVVTPVADTLLELVRRECERSLISLDPNVRLNVEPDTRVWRRRIEAFAEYAHLIKVSDEDLRRLYPEDEPEAVAGAWLRGRCQLVLLTRGGDGATAYSRHGPRRLPAQPVAVRDTVGAGDSFQAALIAYLARHGLDDRASLAGLTREHIDSLLAFATRAAALTCSRTGPDLPRTADFDPR